MKRLLDAWGDLMAAALEKWAAELREATAGFEQRQYWRGYNDAGEDMQAARHAELD